MCYCNEQTMQRKFARFCQKNSGCKIGPPKDLKKSTRLNTTVQRMRQIVVELQYALETLYKQVDEGSIDPFGLWRITAKNCTNFQSNFFVTYLGC